MSAQSQSENLKKIDRASSRPVKRLRAGSGLLLILFLFLTSSTLLVGQEVQKQLIANPSFEELKDGEPLGWRAVTYQPEAVLEVDNLARSGQRSVKISSANGADTSWSTIVKVKPYSRYRLSGWIKTRDIKSAGGQGVLLNIHQQPGMVSRALTGTNDWTRIELVFDSGLNDAFQINCLFGGWGKVTGQAWFDDINLEYISGRALKPQATIYTDQILAPVSKYIYGQFIEHLGRCIYQGLWAEMLEDRKFYFPVDGASSPWKIYGEPHSVHMNPLLIYAGVPVPEIRLKGDGQAAGLAQGELALRTGQKYTGRVVLAGDPGTLPIEVRLVNEENGQTVAAPVIIDKITPDFEKYFFSFISSLTTDQGRLEIVSDGREVFRLAAVSLMPADNLQGFRPEVVKLLRELNSPVYRWPGGNFVSGYNWKDGIGDPDRRPPRKNPAWEGIELNDVGIHEFIAFCRLVGTEPYITVNSGQGNETLAAEEVEYVNGPAASPLGQLRTQNGQAEPFNCRFWSIGNEMYGDWQLGHMPLKDYVLKHNRFAQAMKAKDATIKIIGVGAVGEWSQSMLKNCADYMDFISEHFYVGEQPGLLSHVYQVPRAIKRIAEAHRAYRKTIPELKGQDIKIALDEWNYWYGPYIYGELGTQYFLKDALGIAAGLHEYYRQADIIYMANYAQTVNVIGAIKTSKTEAVFDTTGLVLKLYRNEFGLHPVKITGQSEPLDIMAAWKEDRKTLTIGIINPTTEKQKLSLNLKGLSSFRTDRIFRITGYSEKAVNVPGQEPGVKIAEIEEEFQPGGLAVPPLSINLYQLKKD